MKNIFLQLLLPLTLYGQNKVSLFEAYMHGQSVVYGFNGNVLVSKNGHVIYQKCFGFANYATKKKLDNNSVFDCGSIAKEFTAVGILLLKDKGKISYTDTLRSFFPELPYTNVTVHQLLTHTSGMPDGFGLVTKFFDHTKIATNDDLIRLLAREKPPVLFKAGEDLMYSGTAFNILASIIEKISGQSYKSYMDELIFKPLGMTHTQVANYARSAEEISGYADGYVYSDSLKRFVLAESTQSGWTTYLRGISGEGMIITTTGDLLKWDRALKNHSLLTETTQNEMLSLKAKRSTDPKVQFGYGIRVGNNDLGNYFFHNGYYPGYISMHINYTDEDITTIVLSNNESRADFIADGLSEIALKKNPLTAERHKETAATPIPDIYLGKFMMQLARPPYMVTSPIEIIRKDDKLYIHPTRGNDIELKQESASKFFFADGTDQQIEFQSDNDNHLKVWHTAWGRKREMKKID